MDEIPHSDDVDNLDDLEEHEEDDHQTKVKGKQPISDSSNHPTVQASMPSKSLRIYLFLEGTGRLGYWWVGQDRLFLRYSDLEILCVSVQVSISSIGTKEVDEWCGYWRASQLVSSQDALIVPMEGEHNDDQENLINDVANTCMPYHQDVATNEVLQSQKESLCANICTPELNPHCSKIPVADTQTSYGTYGNDQRNIEYNNLLNQYYELEEKRLQVLQQLQHANYWNPQNPAQSGEYQTEKVLSNHATENYSQHPCSWRSCHGVTVPVIPTACVTCCPSPGLSDSCSQGCLALAPHHFSDGQGYGQSGLCSSCPSCTVDASKKINVTDDNLTKIGMKAAEKVLSSVKSKSSLVSAVCEENEGKEEAAGEHEPKTSSGTQNESDLVTVLSLLPYRHRFSCY
ncbi:hypothetical protein ZIOFF_022176 [Zingiber officinale]|uniref:Uncharacterized protein n=1 Tax=Zingiber officinale TaxID=94328 RepID=A0A8J5HJT4_ZINOF|nr:hypothetical protein ZIOFF_022176 [Zingiber officinale]